jgi:chromosome segregation ATPase
VSNPSADTALETLRELLLTPEQKQLGEMREKLEHLETRLKDKEQRIQDVSEVVPEAIQHRQQNDDSLGEIIAPVVKAAVQESVKGDPNEMAEALFPIVGPVVRRNRFAPPARNRPRCRDARRQSRFRDAHGNSRFRPRCF